LDLIIAKLGSKECAIMETNFKFFFGREVNKVLSGVIQVLSIIFKGLLKGLKWYCIVMYLMLLLKKYQNSMKAFFIIVWESLKIHLNHNIINNNVFKNAND